MSLDAFTLNWQWIAFPALTLLIGIAFTSLLSQMNDKRIYDVNGKQLPLPSVVPDLIQARADRTFGLRFLEAFTKSNLWTIMGFRGPFLLKMYTICHPEYLKIILSGHHSKFPKTNLALRLRYLLGDSGLLLNWGSKWQNHRRLINPGFHFDAIKGMMRQFSIHANDSVKHIREQIEKSENKLNIRLDMNKEVTNMTLAVISQAAFSIQINDLRYPRGYFQQLFQYLEDEICDRLMDPTSWWYMLNPQRAKKADAALREIQDILINEFRKRRELRAQTRSDPNELPKDLLDILLDAEALGIKEGGKGLTTQDLQDNAFTFFFAGFDTTSSLVSWVLLELCIHRDVLQKCQEEVDTVFKTMGDEVIIPYEAIQNFEYLNSVIKETLRFHPSVTSISRNCLEDVEFPSINGSPSYTIPKGSDITLSMSAAHMHPDFWDEPNVFNPDRFSKENIKKTLKHPFQYIPFSGGPRNCIGQRFAQVEAIVLLAIILRNFNLEMTSKDFEEVKVIDMLVQRPRNLMITLSNRL